MKDLADMLTMAVICSQVSLHEAFRKNFNSPNKEGKNSHFKKRQGQPSKQGHVQSMDDENSTPTGKEVEDTENELIFRHNFLLPSI